MTQFAPSIEIINSELFEELDRFSKLARRQPEAVVRLAHLLWSEVLDVEDRLEIVTDTAETVGIGTLEERRSRLVVGTVLMAIMRGYTHPNYWRMAEVEASASGDAALDWPPEDVLRGGQPIAARVPG